jgi:tetratricopeptide (TPR) repeat protein
MTSINSCAERLAALPKDCIRCDSCAKPNAKRRCAHCTAGFYCDRTCQKNHWKTHKAPCSSAVHSKAEFLNPPLPRQVIAVSAHDIQACNTECPICLSDTMNDAIVIHACRHAFCMDCNTNWIRPSGAEFKVATCPLCRGPYQIADVATAIMVKARQLFVKANNSRNTKDNEKKIYYEEAHELVNAFIRAGDGPLTTPIEVLKFKADLLVKLGKFSEAERAVSYMIGRDIDGTSLQEQLKELTLVLEAAGMRLDTKVFDRTFDYMQELQMDYFDQLYGESHPGIYCDLLLLLAECYEGMKEWQSALRYYVNASRGSDQSVQLWNGLARCYYKFGMFERCISICNKAIRLFRHESGCHQYKALSEQALGRRNESVNTMIQACVYEKPWDTEHVKKQLDLYDQMVANNGKQVL